MTDFAAARLKMVDNQLRTSSVTDRRVLAAMGEVPREAFLAAERAGLAYADIAHPLGGGRWLAPPAPFARLVQLAEVRQGDRVLDVGCGTGYSTAVLARLGLEVVGLESDAGLAGRARDNLAAQGVHNAQVVVGGFDGAGLPRDSFDVILVEGEVDVPPASLFALLRDGGRLVALVRTAAPAVAHVFVRSGDDVAARAEFDATLPPLVAQREPEAFEF